MKQRKRKNKKVLVILLIVTFIIAGMLGIFAYSQNQNRIIAEKIKEINNHYNNIVITNKEAVLYDSNKKEIGKIGDGIELTLKELEVTKDTEYFEIVNLDEEYYIKYQDVEKLAKLSSHDDRYKIYIVFNENLVTGDNTTFYDEEDKIIYDFDKSYELPIIIKEENKYGVEFAGRLLYVKSEDIIEVKSNHNTDQTNASGVGVLNYHAFYDESIPAQKAACTTSICHSKSQLKSHLDYFKENNIITLKMKEVEMYVDGKIQLPKSVLLTIDDGGKTEVAIDMLNEYKMYATIFLITSWFEPSLYYQSDYVELHSHSHDMHDPGICTNGQGGGIRCMPEDEIQLDLKTSREKLNNTTYFCYPFYEYNDYSTRMLKEAGFTMAFIGESAYSDNLVHVGDDKLKLRRFVISTATTMNNLKKYLGQIK